MKTSLVDGYICAPLGAIRRTGTSMKNPEKWKPSRIVRDPSTGRYRTNVAGVYGGSWYTAELQHALYIPLIQEHITGFVLDLGCGPVPYHELYSERATGSCCVDWAGSMHTKELLDHFVDLNAPGPLPFAESTFDSAVLSDMLVHITRPHVLMAEVQRVLKPGGKVLITAPFVYWMGEYPHEYFHPSPFALKHLCEAAGMEVLHQEVYGGHADVLMDTLNKFMPAGLPNRFFRLFAQVVLWTGWPQRNRQRTKGPYALGSSMVARKPEV